MKITPAQLKKAVDENILSSEQADRLIDFVANSQIDSVRFNMTHVLYYLGGLVAIAAMSLFMNKGWEHFGGWGIVVLSLTYAVAALYLTERFSASGYTIPAGITATFVIALVPLAVYGLLIAMNWWPDDSLYNEYHRYIKWQWILMELATLMVGAILAWKYRYPFMMMPIAVTLWYISMDLAAMLIGDTPDWELRKLVSLYFGLLMLFFAYWVDLRSKDSADYAFWLYLFGVITFWGSLLSMDSDGEWSKALYCLINVVLILLGVVLQRRVFSIFGALGVSIYLAHLASEVFADDWLFPIVLTFIGLLLVLSGVWWQKHEQQIAETVKKYVPDAFLPYT